MSAPVEKLLARLERVRARGAGQWYASCPTSAHRHGDRSRGLSVKETGDGTVLIHCFSGCSPDLVAAAVGLELSDLFPNKLEPRKGQRQSWNNRDLLCAIRDEAMLVACAAGWIVDGKPLDADDCKRISQAANRIRTALRVGGVCAE